MTKEPGPEQVFRDHLRNGRFMIQRSRSSGRCVFYPRVAEPGSGARDLDWVEASGAGTVYSTTVVRRRPDDGGDYNLALIGLAEGPRLMSRVVGLEPAEVRIGMAVQARIEEHDGEPLLLFAPAG